MIEPHVGDADFRLYLGDALTVLRELPDTSVHCVVTSPPYWRLRDYEVEGQLGLEATPAEYVARLARIFGEVRRVLRHDGVAFLNIGDSFRDKSLALVPQRLGIALQDDGWLIRCDIVWEKPNAMPESVIDRPSRSHEYVWMLTKSPSYFWDQESVREPHKLEYVQNRSPDSYGENTKSARNDRADRSHSFVKRYSGTVVGSPAGRNLRSVWTITTESYPEAHFAVMSQKVAEQAIKAGTSERGCCATCGAPVCRVTETESLDRNELPRDHPEWRPSRYDDGKAGDPQSPGPGQRYSASRTVGWRPSCVCGGETVPCTVLDPFLGAGTTAIVARRLGRQCVGIELNEEYVPLILKRTQQLSLLN